jgi:hypothetical protein
MPTPRHIDSPESRSKKSMRKGVFLEVTILRVDMVISQKSGYSFAERLTEGPKV